MKTAVINTFMEVFYDTLKQDISSHGLFSADAFHDTYIALLSAPDMVLTQKMFKSVYRFILRRELSRRYAVCVPDETFFKLLPDTVTDEQPTEDETEREEVTADGVKRYAQSALAPDEYKLFQLRFIKGFTLRQTGEYIGHSPSFVMRHTNTIKSQLANHFYKTAAL